MSKVNEESQRKDLKEKQMKGTLNVGEAHPPAYHAHEYISGLGLKTLNEYLEAFSGCATEDNRIAGICAETLSRLLRGDPVGDKYVLGLAWAIKKMEEE